jgi:hypothetical protein
MSMSTPMSKTLLLFVVRPRFSSSLSHRLRERWTALWIQIVLNLVGNVHEYTTEQDPVVVVVVVVDVKKPR